MYKSFDELKEVYDLHLVLIQNQTDVDSIPVIIQSPGSFLCCFLLSTLSSLRMKMLPLLGCLLLSSSMLLCLCQLRVSPALVLWFRHSNTLADDFSLLLVAFLGDVLVGTYFQDY